MHCSTNGRRNDLVRLKWPEMTPSHGSSVRQKQVCPAAKVCFHRQSSAFYKFGTFRWMGLLQRPQIWQYWTTLQGPYCLTHQSLSLHTIYNTYWKMSYSQCSKIPTPACKVRHERDHRAEQPHDSNIWHPQQLLHWGEYIYIDWISMIGFAAKKLTTKSYCNYCRLHETS